MSSKCWELSMNLTTYRVTMVVRGYVLLTFFLKYIYLAQLLCPFCPNITSPGRIGQTVQQPKRSQQNLVVSDHNVRPVDNIHWLQCWLLQLASVPTAEPTSAVAATASATGEQDALSKRLAALREWYLKWIIYVEWYHCTVTLQSCKLFHVLWGSYLDKYILNLSHCQSAF